MTSAARPTLPGRESTIWAASTTGSTRNAWSDVRASAEHLAGRVRDGRALLGDPRADRDSVARPGEPEREAEPLVAGPADDGVVAAITPFNFPGNGYQFQFAEVARCLAAGRTQSDVMSWADSLALARALSRASDATHWIFRT